MYNIKHSIGVKASAEAIYKLLTTDEGLSGWWTTQVSGAGDAGSVIRFTFGNNHHDMKVDELEPNKKVVWSCLEGPGEWLEIDFVFEIEEKENQTEIRFVQNNWKSDSKLFPHCNIKWAIFMLSLKDLAETGKGKPFPDDIQINYS